MKISMDGLRRNIAGDFNSLVKKMKSNEDHIEEYEEELESLRQFIGFLLIIEDEDCPDDFNCLTDELDKLEEVEND